MEAGSLQLIDEGSSVYWDVEVGSLEVVDEGSSVYWGDYKDPAAACFEG